MKTILIVEDVELNRELLVQLLEDDYRLCWRTTGRGARPRGAGRPTLSSWTCRCRTWTAGRPAALKADSTLAKIR